MEKPVEPSQTDCCNSGCNPCIFDIYEQQLKLYEKHLEHGEKPISHQENGISQLEYTKFIVVKIINLCNSHNILAFKRQTLDGKEVWWKPGHHFLYKYSTDKVSCTRAYTPIKMKKQQWEDYSDCDFSIIVKKYESGTVSKYLCELDEGCVTLWRGPYGKFDIQPNKFDKIIMLAQGTGIAPFISIIENILYNEDDMTKILLLYCCKFVDTVLFRDELYSFKSYWNFNYKIYISNATDNSKLRYKEPITFKKFSFDDFLNFEPNLLSDQILICGSQQFNDTYDSCISKEFKLKENIVLF